MPLLVSALLVSDAGFAAGRTDHAGASGKKPRQTCNRAGYRIVLDVGHSAEVPGSTSARGVPEYEFNLHLAKRIETTLRDAGFRKALVLITPGPARPGLLARVARANKLPADLFLSIHHDSVPDWFLEAWDIGGKLEGYSDRFAGHSIFISAENPQAEASLLFGKLLGQEMKAKGLRYTPHYTLKEMDWRRRELLDADAGVYRYDQLIVLKDTKMPAVLLEAGSIVNRSEELAMGSEGRRSAIAAAVTKAVDLFCIARAGP
jgi:N-acetylmuramoyl-L-alanine amidase